MTALQVLAAVKKRGQPVSAVCRRFEPLPQIMKNVHYKSGKPLERAEVLSVIANAEQRLNGQGRLVVRPSGTEPLMRVYAESDSDKRTTELLELAKKWVAPAGVS